MNEKNEIREQILAIARDKFINHGYKSVTTDELAQELSISKRTIYQIFSSKKEIFEAVVKELINDAEQKINSVIRSMETNDSSNVIDEMIRLWQIIVENITVYRKALYRDVETKFPDLFELIKNHRQQTIMKYMSQLYDIGSRKGIFKKNINKEVLFIMHELTIQSFIMNSSFNNKVNISLEKAVANIYEILFTGILTSDTICKIESKFDTAYIYSKIDEQENQQQININKVEL